MAVTRTRIRFHTSVATVLLALQAMSIHAASTASQEFMSALERGDLDKASRLVAWGVNVDAQRADGKTLLVLAAKASDVVLVRDLIAAGADVNVTTHNGGTALMFAAIGGDVETQKVLIDGGANVNAIGGFDWTALMVASVKGHVSSVRLLLMSGANPNLPDIYGWTPLMRAVYEGRGSVVKVLLEHPTVDLHAKNDQGATALHLAAGEGNEGLTRSLLLAGADPLAGDRRGRTPENVAVTNGHERVAELLKRP